MELFSSISLGLAFAVSAQNLAYCFLGVMLGMIVGVLPGLGALAAISVLFPITFHIDSGPALIMLAGIYYGTSYGGKTTAILLNVPGTAEHAVICFDGYPLARQGRAGVALLLSTLAALFGAALGNLIVMTFSPLIAEVALIFGSPEYFSIMILGLLAATSMSSGPVSKSLAMVTFGIVLGNVGIDVYSGADRFTFGITDLYDGVSLVVIAMGMFGVTEIVLSFGHATAYKVEDVKLRSMLPTRDDMRRILMPMFRGTILGSFFGALPGTGATISSFLSYGVERRIAKDPSRFGKGAVEGVVAPEAAANGADMTAFIPTLTLGIPGSASMALILSVLIIHGITPGPRLFVDHAEIVWGLIMSFWIGNIMLVVLNIPMIGVWVRLLRIPIHYLYPIIVMFICIGTYSVKLNPFDVWLVLITGVFGLLARLGEFPAGPLMLGYVLGPMMEEHFRRSLILSYGDLGIFVQRPISAGVLCIILLVIVWSFWKSSRRAKLVYSEE